MSILFCTEYVLHRRKVLEKGFVRRGGTIFHGEDLSAVVTWRVYVSSTEMWKNPIGKGDTLESRLWAFYRDWPIRRESGSRKCVKNRVKWRILLVWDAPWTVLAENLHGRRFLYKKADSDLRKIGSQAKKFVMKDFAGKFGAQFFHIANKIEAPISFLNQNSINPWQQ